MGAKTWMLVHSVGNPADILRGYPALNRAATKELVSTLFSSQKLEELEDGSLDFTCPPDDEIVAGCFPGLVVLAANEFGIDYPSTLSAPFLNAFSRGSLFLHAMHSAVDWFSFAVWTDGMLDRSLSLSPDSGILENIGTPLPFEAPYWAGENPVSDPDDEDDGYPFVFHPLELGEAALLALFGYCLEGAVDDTQVEPERIPLMRFKRT